MHPEGARRVTLRSRFECLFSMTLPPGLLTLLPYGGFMSVLPVTRAMSAAEQGAKVKTIFSEMVKCGGDAGQCSSARPGAAERRTCHACYCAGLQYGFARAHRDEAKDKELAMIRDECDAFLEEPGVMETMLTLVAVAAVTLVNGALKFIVRKISAFERPASFISLQHTIAEKVFVAQFFNTAVSLLAG